VILIYLITTDVFYLLLDSFLFLAFGNLNMTKMLLGIIFAGLLLSTVFLSGCTISGNTGMVCRKVVKEFKGCDSVEGCRCLHKSWAGLGSCDTCECEECLVS